MAGRSNWPLIINLGNSIIGVAVLAMPFCFKQCGILLGMLTLLFCTWLTLCSCSLLMKAGIISRRRSYEFLAYHTHGATGKLVSEIGMIGMQMGTLIAQIVVIGDLGPAIISKLLGIENTNNLRTLVLVLLCLGIGLPMGLLKDLRSVSKGSTLCIAFYCLFIVYVLVMSVPSLWSGAWYFKVNFWRPQGLFQCLPILSFSFGCQTQLFLVYEELPEPSLKAIKGVISSAVNLCAVAYLLVGFFGYITFHAIDVPGDILAAFPSTIVADLIKLCFCFSIVITFPVIIFPCRASIYTLLFAKKTKAFDDSLEGGSYIPENLFKLITIFIIMVSMITGILIPNVEFILGMNGAIMGTLICYIFPALFFIKVLGNKSEGKSTAQLVLFLGLTILLVSTFATLSSQDKGHTHPDTGVKEILDPNDLGMDAKARDAKQAPSPNKPTINPNLGAADIRPPDNLAKEKQAANEKRQEPPIPNPPVSHEENVAAKVDSSVIKKNGSAAKLKAGDSKNEIADVKVKEPVVDEGKVREANLVAKEKQLETAHKAKELELKEKEKKQEEILEKLEKHRQDQESLLKEQIKVLKELKDHKKDDEVNKEEVVPVVKEEVVKEKPDIKDEIVKQQQELLNQQQQVNLQQQELIKQQQEQLNIQMLKDQMKMAKASAKPQAQIQQQVVDGGVKAPQPDGQINPQQGLNQQQQGLNLAAQQQGVNQPAQQQLLNQPAQQQLLNQPAQQGLNQPAQQGLNQQQQGINQPAQQMVDQRQQNIPNKLLKEVGQPGEGLDQHQQLLNQPQVLDQQQQGMKEGMNPGINAHNVINQKP